MHHVHYLQYNTMAGSTYNNTICITRSTKQYDYLLNLWHQFLYYLQNNTITDATFIHILL